MFSCRVFYLEMPEEAVIERLSMRRTDPATGNVYHLDLQPPPDAIKHRLKQYPKDQKVQVQN